MASPDILPISVHGDEIALHFMSAADEPWVSLLLDEFARFEGKPRRLLDEHLRTSLPFDAPPLKLRLARFALKRLWRTQVVAAVRPRVARTHLFGAAAGRPTSSAAILDEVSADLKVSPADLSDALFADLPSEKRMSPPKEEISPTDLCLRANLLLVQGMLERSTEVRLLLQGNARPVVRQAKLRGLICTVTGDAASRSTRLEISGPLSLFKRTLVYGRALAELVPQLSWCNRFHVEARVLLSGQAKRLALVSGAPIFPAKRPKTFDSRVEKRFAREFAKQAPDWDIIREPEPIPIGRSLIFPDFALVHRRPPFERWILEIIGFWTPDYLQRKLASLAKAGLERLILCIDAERNCSDADLPPYARVVRYKRKIDVEAVSAILEAESECSLLAADIDGSR